MTVHPLDGVFGVDDGGAGPAAFVAALCAVERALAVACARAGLVPVSTADLIAAECDDLAQFDPAELSRRSVAGGNPVIPLVNELRARVEARGGADAARGVHLGATSQDVMDSALMLLARTALDDIVTVTVACADRAAELAAEHRDTPMAARTLLQQAVPTTFGALAATWGAALDRAAGRADQLRATLPAQLGGAAGTLAPLHPHGLDVLAAFAAELGLAAPDGVWHGDRGPVLDLAGVLGGVAAAAGKVATDLVLLAQSEVGEVRERAPGGSSAMAHKQNPIAAVTARAAAMQVPGLVATLLSAMTTFELQRGAGPWHAEWPALLSALRFSTGAVTRLRVALDVEVDTAAMRAHLETLGDTLDVADTGHATELVDRYLEGRP